MISVKSEQASTMERLLVFDPRLPPPNDIWLKGYYKGLEYLQASVMSAAENIAEEARNAE